MTVFDFDSFPTIYTKRLCLRRITAEDSLAWAAILGDEQVIRFLSDINNPLNSPELITPLIQWAHQIFENKSGIRWAISYADQPALIGTCGFHNLDTTNHKAAIGYELGSTYWRKGIMKEALTAVIHFCFSVLALHRIEADVTDGNEASAGILRSLGFIHEGTWREAVFTKGHFRDLWQFGLLAKEY